MTNKEKLEYAFKRWIEDFMYMQTNRWDRLSIGEVDILSDYCWKEFLGYLTDVMEESSK